MKRINGLMLLPIMLGIIMLAACSGSSKAGNVTVGSSCEGIDSMSAAVFCEGKKVLFCSSLTKYKYIVQTECPRDQVCKLSSDGKATSCVDPK